MIESLEIRAAVPSDADDLHAIRRDAIVSLAGEYGSDAAERWAGSAPRDRVERAIATGGVWVAQLGSTAAGWVGIRGATIESLYVEPVAARQGVGSALLAHAEAQIRASGSCSASLDASPNAAPFYARRGYEPAGGIEPNDALPMRKRLGGKYHTESVTMSIVITAFERSPDGGKGLARDTRVRWALEEVGQTYDVRLVSFAALKEPAHLALHPFGQIPTLEEGGLALFETGAIVLHLAERHGGLLPDDPNARARAIAWMFAAVNTIEPPILELVTAKLLEGDEPWTRERLPRLEERLRVRLQQLSARLGDAEWLDGSFSAGDLMMVSVLLRVRSSGLLDEHPNLAAYVARGEARPAYARAFAAQLAING